MWKNNHFWPTTQKNGFKTLGRYTLSCRGRFDPRPVIGYFGPQWVGLSKKIFHLNVHWNICGKCFINKIFSPCTQWAPEVREAKNCWFTSNQVKTYSVPAQPNGENFFFNFTPRDLRTSGAIEIINKINIPQFYQLTNFHSTNNQCS